MKKLSLRSLVVVLALFFTPLNAQVYIQQIQLGPKVGVNIANVTGDDATFAGQNLDSKIGFAGGIFFLFQVSNLFAIQPEAYYTMKGATLSYDVIDLTYTYNYIELPLLLKLIIPVEGSNIRPSVYAGPVLSFNTTAEVKAVYQGQIELYDISDDTQSTDFSLAFGGGMGFMIGNNELGFDIRYILGLKSIDDTSRNEDEKNTVINFNIYFGFSL